ncbi:hypothetical protein CAEBREN_13421 [Caenorhabditis brenneri]|uniref:Protein kinase domain-containing protein n=1 Tax=Caenorhabditis brenneri TaxID=135651 RepID=G0NN39_CAEBE|nr:hypothetical protein CAEBREN_13421 [Caenorhabditis brenneri]
MELGNLLPADSENHLDLERNFHMNKSLVENLKLIQTCKQSILQKGQLKMEKPKNPNDAGKRLNVMVRSVLDFDNATHHNLINLELKVLTEIEGHPNILPLIGFIQDKGQISIITEYPDGGNLQDYLKGFNGGLEVFSFLKSGPTFKNRLTPMRTGYNVYRSDLDSKLRSLCTFDLLSFAYQIAKGMRHMSNNSVRLIFVLAVLNLEFSVLSPATITS